MPKFQGVIGTQVSVTGATTIVIGDTVFKTSNRSIWDYGVFGISMTRMSTTAVSVYVVGDLSGITVPIAGISGIATTTSTLIPLIQERIIGTGAAGNSQQTAFAGVPTPRRIIFGNSGIVGATWSAVVSAMLQAGD